MNKKDKVSLGVGVVALGTLGVYLVVQHKKGSEPLEAMAAEVFSIGSDGFVPVEEEVGGETEFPEAEDE
jgi:hypothetical protein